MKSFFLNNLVLITLLLLVSMPLQKSHGLQVEDLYSYQVVVDNESDSERSRAFQEAFKAVILKVTGDRRWLVEPDVERAIANAQSYVEGIQYGSRISTQFLSIDNNDLQSLGRERFIEVSFASSLVQDLLQSANIPVWTSNRPSVLVWMVLQDSAGDRTLFTPELNPEISEYIENFARIRAIPIIFPVLDFEDRENLSEDDVWSLDADKIVQASNRYGADSILSGRLHFTSLGELIGLWQFIFQGDIEVFDGVEENLDAYLEVPLDRITNQLASYFAIAPHIRPLETVQLKVEGISDLSAYSSLMNYVSGLGLVQNAKASSLNGEILELELDLLGGSAELFELIGLDRDLLPIQSSQRDDLKVLHYRWTR